MTRFGASTGEAACDSGNDLTTAVMIDDIAKLDAVPRRAGGRRA
jgi:hypothetical protein